MIYFLTGKLGSGKTLCAIGRINDALSSGRPVATNINLNTSNLPCSKPSTKGFRIVRLPDKPSSSDFEALGVGNPTYDESRNGLIVLDECGTWFNSRTWNDKSRSSVIDWLLHARKLGWDVIFIVQNIAIVDKQARLALSELVVYCRRMDRLPIPLLSTFLKFFSFSAITFPKLHVAFVKYGDSINSPVVDKWIYSGSSLYSSYDTKQSFSDNYQDGLYSVLPPFYLSSPSPSKFGLSFIMRLTRVYFRKTSRLKLFLIGFLSAAPFFFFFNPFGPSLPSPPQSSYESGIADLKLDYFISYNHSYDASFVSKSGVKSSLSDILASGYTIRVFKNKFILSKGDENVTFTY